MSDSTAGQSGFGSISAAESGAAAMAADVPVADLRSQPRQRKAAAAAMPHIELEREDGSKVRVELNGRALVIGRWAEAGLVLNSPQISRRHAEVSRDPFGRWWIRDLGSRNGFRVNGERLKEHSLRDGDEIAIQHFALRFFEPRPEPIVAADTSSTVMVADAPDIEVTALEHGPSAKIDAMHLATLTEFGHRLIQTADAPQRMLLLCRLMTRPDFHARSAVVLRLSRQREEELPQSLCAPATAAGEHAGLPYVSRRLMAVVRETRAPMLASSAPARAPGSLELSIYHGAVPTAAIACPLRIDDDSIDLLYVTFPAEFGTMEWMALVSIAAQQFQQAENTLTLQRQASERSDLERELSRARDIQMRLVPRKVEIAGLEVEIGFEPCRWVGGDLVDVVRLPDGRVALLIADVCGKGMSAALVGSGMHTVIRGLLATGVDLPATMNHLNAHLCSYLPDSSFVTMLAVMLDPATGELQSINAGHPGGVVVKADGSLRTLPDGQNLPLGVVARELVVNTGRLDVGELLAMFTDGLTELRDESGRMIGTDGLTAMLGRIYGGDSASLAGVSAALSTALDQVQGGSMPLDDRTYLLARRSI